MAIPYTNYPLLQPPIHQLPPALVPTDLLAAIEGWDARTAWPGTGVSAPGAGGYLNRSLLPSSISPLEGAGRMSQEGGIIGRASSVIPSKADFAVGGGHYIAGGRSVRGQRTLLEVNHNKAITKKLVSAIHYQQVLDCVSQNVQVFDEVNVATALHRLAKLQPPGPSSNPSPIVYSDQFQQLVAAVRRLLPRFEAQAVSNTMWAFATLLYFPENNLLDALASHAASIIRSFRPQATSNTLWAFAKLGYCPCKALLDAGSRQMLQDLSKSVPQDISNTLWAFAALRHHPGAELMEQAASQAIMTIQRFKPQELANTLWSFAMLDHDPSTPMLDTMAIQMVAIIQGFRPQAVSNSLWAYAKLGYNPGILLLDVASQKAAGMLHQYTSQELANTVWAIAVLEHYPGANLLNSAAMQIARRIEQFSPQDMANSIWAFAQLNHQSSSELTHAVSYFILRHWQHMKAGDAVKALAALALLGGCPSTTWQLLLAKLASLPVSGLSQHELQQIFQMHLLLKAGDLSSKAPDSSLPQTLVKESKVAWQASVQQKGWMSPMHHEVSQALWRLGFAHQNNCITADGLHTANIILDGTNVAIEVQEASHFAANRQHLLGRSIAKSRLLESSGYIAVAVAQFDWVECATADQRQRLLSRILSTAHLKTSHALSLFSTSRSSFNLHSTQSSTGSPYSSAPSTVPFSFEIPQSAGISLPPRSSCFSMESLSRSNQ